MLRSVYLVTVRTGRGQLHIPMVQVMSAGGKMTRCADMGKRYFQIGKRHISPIKENKANGQVATISVSENKDYFGMIFYSGFLFYNMLKEKRG